MGQNSYMLEARMPFYMCTTNNNTEFGLQIVEVEQF